MEIILVIVLEKWMLQLFVEDSFEDSGEKLPSREDEEEARNLQRRANLDVYQLNQVRLSPQ